MVHLKIVASLALFCFGQTAASGWSQEEKKAQNDERVFEGKIVDLKGRPIVDALIEWGDFRTKSARQTTRTSMNGTYRLVAKKVGKNYRLGVYAKGFAPVWRDGMIPQKGKSTRQDFKLKKGGFIEGTVLSNHSKKPIANAQVTVMTPSMGFESSFSTTIPPTPLPGPSRTVRTDKYGKFRIEDLGNNDYSRKKEIVSIKVVASNHYPFHENRKYNQAINVVLAGGAPAKQGIIRAQVVDKKTGEPIASFVVGKRYTSSVQKFDSKLGMYVDKSVKADRNHHRFVYAIGYEPKLVTLESFGVREMKVSKIELTRSPALRGRIVDEKTGKPIEGVKIVCAQAGRYFPWDAFDSVHDGFHPMKMVQRATTDNKGEFQFAEGSSKNHLYLFPKSSHIRQIVSPEMRGKSDQEGRVTIQLSKAASISGKYVRDGKVLPGSQIRLHKYQQTKPEEMWETVVADKDGKFRFDNLKKGTYSISGYVTRKLELKPGEQLEVDLGGDLGPHTLTGKAAPFVRIFIRPQIKGWGYVQFETKADEDGNYEFKGLKNGDYGVTLMHFSEASGTFLDGFDSVTIKGNTKKDFKHFKGF